MNRKIIAMISIISLLVLMLGACGGSSTGTQESSSESEQKVNAEDVISVEGVTYELKSGVNICFKLKNVTDDHLESIMLTNVQFIDKDNTVIDTDMIGDNGANLDPDQAGIYSKWFSQYQSFDEMAGEIAQIKIQTIQVFKEWNNFDTQIDASYADPIVINVKDIKEN